MSNILASGIRNVPHFVAFDTMAKNRLDAVQIDKLLVYIIDTVDASALPALAAQFDVLGYKGMRLATTEEQQREVIKKAIELKRYKGTVWAVKEAMRAIGYPEALITEGVGSGPNGWAEFTIALEAGENVISVSNIDEILKMIDEYKNVRSHLTNVSFLINMEDDLLTVGDISQENPNVNDEDVLSIGSNFKYNGEFTYNGTKNYSSDSDILEVNITTV